MGTALAKPRPGARCEREGCGGTLAVREGRREGGGGAATATAICSRSFRKENFVRKENAAVAHVGSVGSIAVAGGPV